MSYDKQTWQTGDVITANKLNHMEDGIASSGGGRFVATATFDEEAEGWYTDYTAQEIYDAFENGMDIWIKLSYDEAFAYMNAINAFITYTDESKTTVGQFDVLVLSLDGNTFNSFATQDSMNEPLFMPDGQKNA